MGRRYVATRDVVVGLPTAACRVEVDLMTAASDGTGAPMETPLYIIS
jgi:hypothetical protein